MAWKDNAFGISIDNTMNVDFAKFRSEGGKFVIIKIGDGFIPNQSFSDQYSKAKAAGLAVIANYVSIPAYSDYTYTGLPLALLVEIRKWIGTKKFEAFIVSIEENLTEDTKVPSSDSPISYTAEQIVRTLTKEGQKILVRTSDGFVQKYSPSVSNWSDSFGFVLADWRYRTKDNNGVWSVVNYFKAFAANTVSDIKAQFPTVELKNPLVPGKTPQLKFWEYANVYTLPYVTSWDGKVLKSFQSVWFNGSEDAMNTYLNFTPPNNGGDGGNTGGGTTGGGGTGTTVDLSGVNAKLDQIIAMNTQILQGINDLKSVFSVFTKTTSQGFLGSIVSLFKK